METPALGPQCRLEWSYIACPYLLGASAGSSNSKTHDCVTEDEGMLNYHMLCMREA